MTATYTVHMTTTGRWLCRDCAANCDVATTADASTSRPVEPCNVCDRPFPADDACICGDDHDCRSTGCDDACHACN